MNKAGGIVAMVAGVFGVVAAILTLGVGGLGSALNADHAGFIIGLGWGGIVFSFLVIVFGAVALSGSMAAGVSLIVCSVLGAVLGGTLVAVFMALSFIGGIVCLIGSRETPITFHGPLNSVHPMQAAETNDIYSTLERLAELKSKNVLTEAEFLAEKDKLLSRRIGISDKRYSTPLIADARRTLSPMTAFIIAFALLLPFFVLGGFGHLDAELLGLVVVVVGTSIWAAVESKSLHLGEYRTSLAAGPVVLFIGVAGFWIVGFPWYLVVRSKIMGGALERSDAPQSGLSIGKPVGVFAMLAVVVLVALVFFIRSQ
jgi:hypothetical protein